MGWLYLRRDSCMNIYWLTVSRSGWGFEKMGWLYLGQDRCMRMVLLYLVQDGSVRIWAGCI
jgi:hypothetical protein